MGTRVEVLLAPGAPPGTERALTRLFQRWERALTRFDPRSHLGRINAGAGRPVIVPRWVLDVVDRALAAASATGGAFDPALGRQIAAVGYGTSFERLPRVLAPLAIPPMPGGGWRDVTVDREARTVTVPAGVALDLGGIAKGMAVDAAIALLRDAGTPWALVSAGGDLAVIGSPPGRDGWSVAVPTPGGEERVTLHGGAIATSGLARRRWRQGPQERHHLIDPRTGAPAAPELWSASAVAWTCEQAEVAATAAFVLGRDAGARFLAERGLPGLLVPRDAPPVAASGWPRHRRAA
jgi:thiamine biosynthesis lipoprotein